MSEPLVQYVLEATPEQLQALALEDMALCQAWHNSLLDDPEKASHFQDLPARVAAWTADHVPEQRATEGNRQQPLLRLCVDALERRGVPELARDELDLLFFVHGLIKRVKARGPYQRPMDLIAPSIDAIAARREALPPVPGLPTLAGHLTVVTEFTVRGAASREIRKFGGLEDAFRGPVLRRTGPLKIVGDIPDGTAVVVEGDSCYVSGFVLGRLLVREHAEVRENISGLVIAQRGDIRARALLNRATAIAKRGGIRCGEAQAPALVYAGTQLAVSASAVQGAFFAPRIWVQHNLRGGCWHVTDRLKAGAFIHTDQRPLDIVLRTRIGCEDFGEALPPEANDLLRRVIQHQARIDYLTQLRDRQAEEAEHYASTALLYVFSGAGARDALQEVDALKRRRAFILRMMTGLHLLTRSLTVQLREGRLDGADARQSRLSVERAIQRSLAEVRSELAELKVEGSYPEDLDAEWENLIALHGSSSGSPAAETLSRAILRFHESRKSWQEEIMQLDETIGGMRERLAGDRGRRTLIQRAQDEGTSQPVLLQLTRAARERGPDDPVVRRMEAPFFRRMLKLLKKRNAWIARYGGEAEEEQTALDAIHARLRDEYGLEPALDHPSPRVEGIFGEGVRLHAGELQPLDGEGSNGALVVADDSGGEMIAYGLRDSNIARLGTAMPGE